MKNLIILLSISVLMLGCNDDHRALERLDETMAEYVFLRENREYEKIVEFIPDEIIESLINQNYVNFERTHITIPQVKELVVSMMQSSEGDFEILSFKYLEPTEKKISKGVWFYAIPYETKGKISIVENTFIFHERGFILAISKDRGRTFKLVIYRDEKTKLALDRNFDNISEKLSISFPVDNMNEILTNSIANEVQAYEERDSRLYEEYKKAIVMLTLSNDQGPVARGTGFVLGDYVITNYHVVYAPEFKYLEITDFNKQVVKWDEIIQHDPNFDYAIIKLNPSSNVFSFKSYANEEVAVGSKVYSIGHPASSFEFTFSQGMITGGESGLYQIDNDATFGMSGAPIFNKEGTVLGILTAVESTNTSVFAVDIRILNLEKILQNIEN